MLSYSITPGFWLWCSATTTPGLVAVCWATMTPGLVVLAATIFLIFARSIPCIAIRLSNSSLEPFSSPPRLMLPVAPPTLRVPDAVGANVKPPFPPVAVPLVVDLQPFP